jgi:hypothetical protein
MLPRLLLALAICAGLMSPAFARNYYVVQSIKTQKCSVLPKKPKGKTVKLVKGSGIYKTRTEARAALRTFPACKS